MTHNIDFTSLDFETYSPINSLPLSVNINFCGWITFNKEITQKILLGESHRTLTGLEKSLIALDKNYRYALLMFDKKQKVVGIKFFQEASPNSIYIDFGDIKKEPGCLPMPVAGIPSSSFIDPEGFFDTYKGNFGGDHKCIYNEERHTLYFKERPEKEYTLSDSTISKIDEVLKKLECR